MPLAREQIAARIAKEIKNGFYVNLGIGIPTLVANYIPTNMQVMLQSENGLLGMGSYPIETSEFSEVDPDLINAGKETVTEAKGASYFSSADSFAMIRGGHIDLTVLGAFEVDELGNIASWMVPGKLVKGMGGAMDLVAGAQNIIVAMNHAHPKTGESKILKRCTLPLTGVNCVKKIVTDLAVLEIKNQKFYLLERAPGVSIDTIQKYTDAHLIIPEYVPEISI